MSKPEHIHVIGAGLVGSLMSVMLGQRGYRVTVFEYRADARSNNVDSGRSINLALSSRGIAALTKAGLMAQVKKLLIPMKGRMLHLADGKTEFMPYGQRDDEVIYSISRRDLNMLLIDQAEQSSQVKVRFETKLNDIEFENQQLSTIDISTNQADREPFELIIGSDGAGSKTRRLLMPINGGISTSDFLDHDYKELEIPAAAGDGAARFQIEPNALHVWPRGKFMLIALPNQDGSFTVTLFLPKTGPESFQALEDPDNLKPFFEQYFPDAIQLIPDLAEDFNSNPTGRLGTVRCNKWHHQSQALIIGDASHAIVPFHGQGMNSGLEDCLELDRLLDQHNDDWAIVLPEFDRIRRPNANAIADMALENYVTMRSSVIDPKFQLKKELGFELERRFPDRFIPRYSMVMFHLIPYREALERGEFQQAILDELVAGKTAIDEIDFELAESLIKKQLSPAT
jgi:kynurenine 3-monooxygenase